MFASHDQIRPLPSGPVGEALLAALLLAPLVLSGAWAMAGPYPGLAAGLALGGWIGVTALLVAGLRTGHPHDRFGLANGVTLLRAGGVLVLATGLLHGPFSDLDGWFAVGVLIALLLLDGVDGALARRAGLASSFGARFDMEVDSAFALTLALLLWQTQGFAPWIVLLGLPRYAFALAMLFDPDLGRDLPPSVARKIVCVQQIGTLCILFAPGLPVPAATALAGASAATLVWSFGRDILRQSRIGGVRQRRADQRKNAPGTAPARHTRP